MELSSTEWGFNDFDADRAARLTAAPPPDELIEMLASALGHAITNLDYRLGIDSKENAFTICRSTVQFKIPPELYDYFFNSRTGYRAHYWNSPEDGATFNEKLVSRLAVVLDTRLSEPLAACKIIVEHNGHSRHDIADGKLEISKDALLRSIDTTQSKVWICERLISEDCTTITDIGLAVLSEAARSPQKLQITKWADNINPATKTRGEGLRAPLPIEDYSWIDIKGSFVEPSGTICQIKSQDVRSKQLHEHGWT